MAYESKDYYRNIQPLPAEREELERQQTHLKYDHKKRLTGIINGQFTAMRPLHVGTGLFVDPALVGVESEAPLIKSFYRVNDRLTVPASSLKGAIRSLIEMFTYACITGQRRGKNGACQYIPRGRVKRTKLCTVCQMFGCLGYEGQVYLEDAQQVEGGTAVEYIPKQYNDPRKQFGRRYYPHELVDPGERTWPLQVATAQSRFDFRLRFQNLTHAQIGILLIALGQARPPLCLRLGAGKNSGLGTIQFSELTAEQVQVSQLYTEYESQPAWQPIDKEYCIEKAREKTDARILAQLQVDLGCAVVVEER